jgi:1-acyl-sn-glycerol-3-phosphate acyltransferase
VSERSLPKLKVPDPSRLLRRLEFPYRAPTTPTTVEPARSAAKSGIDYDTGWARKPAARWARAALVEGVMRPTIAVVASPERLGLDRLETLRTAEPTPPVIFAANHHSHADTPLLLTSIPDPWRHKLFVGAAADYFFRTRVTGAVAALALNAIPIERAKVTRRSADAAAELLGDGWSLLIYPEGGRSPDGWGQQFRGGAAYLSSRCDVPVIPVHLAGTGRILRKGRNVPNRSVTTVTFGAPLRPRSGEDSRRYATRIEGAVAALADESSTDWYTARRRAHAGETPSLGGPGAGSWRRAWALGDRGPRRRRTQRRSWPEVG